MKKNLLMVLLVFILAGGLFAQEGSWSLWGTVVIGSRFDLEGLPYTSSDLTPNAKRVMVKGAGYWEPYDYYGPINGNLGLGYNREELGVNLFFNQRDYDVIGGEVTYNGADMHLQFSSDMTKLLQGKFSIGRLWGNYKVFDLVYLEAAFNSKQTEYWFSDKTGAGDLNRYGGWKNTLYNFNWGDTFTAVDHHNFFLVDVQTPLGVSAGFMMPNVFSNGDAHGDGQGTFINNRHTSHYTENLQGDDSNGQLFYNDSWMQTIFAAKYSGTPIEAALQYKILQSRLYAGGKFSSGPINAGISFNGILNPTSGGKVGGEKRTGYTFFKIGASLDYNAGAFGGGLGLWYGLDGDTSLDAKKWPIRESMKAAKYTKNTTNLSIRQNVTDVYSDYKNYSTQFGIEPYVSYNIIPAYLRAELKFGLHFDDAVSVTKYKSSYRNRPANINPIDGSYITKYTDIDDVTSTFHFLISPQLFFNFAGNGAGGYWSMGNGLLVRYRIASTELGRNKNPTNNYDRALRSDVSNYTNALDIVFKFSF